MNIICRTCLAGIDENVVVCVCRDSVFFNCKDCNWHKGRCDWQLIEIDSILKYSKVDDDTKNNWISHHKNKLKQRKWIWEMHIANDHPAVKKIKKE